ncbi:hypothetical protein [Methylorubrum extorquens]|uniref:hypothetical protein n=1 Tax=Methylorubrum extorquens TaxID=408 RepID=UPI0013015E6F|nr:hypothetical protein [Methylorubrum extorquens]MCP1545281.1 hypothetical protein [Methylorubrum extorquens]MCP1587372.1 hypothetical protein [Methylorubrum extorquens]
MAAPSGSGDWGAIEAAEGAAIFVPAVTLIQKFETRSPASPSVTTSWSSTSPIANSVPAAVALKVRRETTVLLSLSGRAPVPGGDDALPATSVQTMVPPMSTRMKRVPVSSVQIASTRCAFSVVRICWSVASVPIGASAFAIYGSTVLPSSCLADVPSRENLRSMLSNPVLPASCDALVTPVE